MDLHKRFGNLVRAHRLRLGMKQAELAEAAGLSPNMIGKVERGEAALRFPNIEQIARALEVDPAELFAIDPGSNHYQRPDLFDLTAELSGLSDVELKWASEMLALTLRMFRSNTR
ncbi:helix-turn-helix domain-containing protein [Sphingomonas sp. Ant H11]|jgi:transcriptional regulator with XRE-family HTH domain|uniref:helix-turn-helix domain-containing protein n=1 Tax=Sphingomonas sp. Ant H11 TaxID=1564113 RepID=UPI0009DCAEAC|nr:helix-turn-helix transcriptional regulator [Sphingomonas sp. Ant H11]